MQPNRTLVVLEAKNSAMDTDREHFAFILTKFLISPQEAHPTY